MKNSREIHNEKDIADLLEADLPLNEGIVVKADAGTHGKMIMLSKNRQELEASIQETKPGIINPIGVVGQELIQKWFYDLRIIVSKEKGKDPTCLPVSMVRGGFKDFRTNTYLGNLVFHAKLPNAIQKLAIKCGNALGKENPAWIFALDAMVNVKDNKSVDDVALKTELENAANAWLPVQKVKADETRLTDFPVWNKQLEAAFKTYKTSKPYQNINLILEESIESNQQAVVFHEANSCPEFWENTRLATGFNVAELLLKGAKSLID